MADPTQSRPCPNKPAAGRTEQVRGDVGGGAVGELPVGGMHVDGGGEPREPRPVCGLDILVAGVVLMQ